MNPVRIASSDWKPYKSYGLIRVIFKTSSVTPDFFYVFNLVLSFSTCSQSFNKICVWEVLGANVLKRVANLDIWMLTERYWGQESCLGKETTGFILFHM